MVIKKFLHSCIVIEDHGQRLGIDSGAFCFVEKHIKPIDLGPLDLIVLTHTHQDHYDPVVLKSLLRRKRATLLASQEILDMLKKDGVGREEDYISALSGMTRGNVQGFSCTSYEMSHGALPVEVPHNMGFMINQTVLHPGDSVVFQGMPSCDVLCLPIAGPWISLTSALSAALAFHPRYVVPIHDVMIKDFALQRMYALCKNALGKEGIGFHPLKHGETFKV